jgi:hypothetical protein
VNAGTRGATQADDAKLPDTSASRMEDRRRQSIQTHDCLGARLIHIQPWIGLVVAPC